MEKRIGLSACNPEEIQARKVHGQGDLRYRIRRDQTLKSVCELLDQTLPETDPSSVFHYTSLVRGPRWVFNHL